MKITNKLKIWTVITLIIIVVGMALYGFLGFNQDYDYKDAYDVEVKVYNVDKSTEITKNACEDFFTKNIITYRYKSFTLSEDADGNSVLRYRIVKKSTKNLRVDSNELEKSIETALANANLNLKVSVNATEGANTFLSNIGMICLALGIAIVAIVVYLFFIEKIASALSVIASGVIGSLMFIALIGITRIPAYPYIELSLVFTALATVILSAGLVSRFREEIKNIGNAKLSNADIADKVFKDSLVRYSFFAGCLILVALLLIILGSTTLKYLGLQIVIIAISAIFSSLIWTPVIWSLIKKDSKSYNSKD